MDKELMLINISSLSIPGELELFDIESDPFQENNIAAENPDIVKKMNAYYEKWWGKVEVRMTERWGILN